MKSRWRADVLLQDRTPLSLTPLSLPAGGEVRVARRQFDDAVQVIGKNHTAVDVKWMRSPRLAHACPQ